MVSVVVVVVVVVGGGVARVVGGGTDPVNGAWQVKVEKKRPMLMPALKCTSAWMKHKPWTLAKRGTETVFGESGPIRKS